MATVQKCTPKENNDWESTIIKTLVTLCKRPPQSPPNLLDTLHNGLVMVLSGDCRKYHPIYVTGFSVLFRHSFRPFPRWARQPSAGSTFRAGSFSCKMSSLVENMLEMWINCGDNYSPTVTGENPMPPTGITFALPSCCIPKWNSPYGTCSTIHSMLKASQSNGKKSPITPHHVSFFLAQKRSLSR